ncbi:UPF0047 family protein [Natronomonas moolapensis 8.8.11]|uniref:UPF0047 family protein n=1 Tax=Natronomonas moolapensis (strain DSM 18674 / CECT 7526 / JCM 14361 / 8.8.11) TaxID=268739 RepID=M1XKR7_NATM8|nr:secondary thiamine-phosphate synthase enzyme YjbQ [Natronomonas moolapensis]CCQ36384.1 UPF0047 family protein [Natronomonas moolapensis 8.8.11]
MELRVSTEDRIDVVDVTERIEAEIQTVERGLCTVFAEHTTAAVSINEAEPRLIEDVKAFVAELSAPSGWRHDALDGNADAHLRSSVLGRDVSVPVRDGALALGTWQSILLIECDGPCERSVSVTVTPSIE